MKLPLSTTYVTFMVAMGASLADRAWGRESAVYRIAGVLSVIAGWFMTALFAFLLAFTISILIYKFGFYLAIAFFIAELFMLYRSQKKHKEEIAEDKDDIFEFEAEDALSEEKSTEILIFESLKNINKVIGYINKLYANTIEGLEKYDIELLRKNDKDVKKLYKQGNKLKDKLFHIVKSNKGRDIVISNNYIKLLDKIQDLIQSMHFISKMSKEYVDNTHSELKPDQIKDLEKIRNVLVRLMNEMQIALANRDLARLKKLYKTSDLDCTIEEAINNQVMRIQKDESSPKNSRMYLSLLLETKDIEESLTKLLRIIFDATKNIMTNNQNQDQKKTPVKSVKIDNNVTDKAGKTNKSIESDAFSKTNETDKTDNPDQNQSE
jgi:Na+/phosphate symporter